MERGRGAGRVTRRRGAPGARSPMSRNIDHDLIRQILLGIGEDPDREGLAKTPDRVVRALDFLTSGYEQDPVEVIGGHVQPIFHWQVDLGKVGDSNRLFISDNFSHDVFPGNERWPAWLPRQERPA